MVKVESQPYNEKSPFGRGATVVTGDNIEYSKQRVEAIRAIKSGSATPEQRALVSETDAVIQEALGTRGGQ